jgi:hypothetical protein
MPNHPSTPKQLKTLRITGKARAMTQLPVQPGFPEIERGEEIAARNPIQVFSFRRRSVLGHASCLFPNWKGSQRVSGKTASSQQVSELAS